MRQRCSLDYTSEVYKQFHYFKCKMNIKDAPRSIFNQLYLGYNSALLKQVFYRSFV